MRRAIALGAIAAAVALGACGDSEDSDRERGDETAASAAEGGASVGREIAFTRATSEDRFDDIFVMNADGSDQAQLTDTPETSETAPAWSPDGERIAFNRGENIWAMNADGSEQTNLTDASETGGVSPAFSPDGEQIAFTVGGGGRSDIWMMNADGGDRTKLTASPDAFEREPAWSPDGRRITFVSEPREATNPEAANGDIWLMNADGSDPRSLTSGSELDGIIPGRPAISPDGKRIAFLGLRNGTEEAAVWVMNSDGSDPTRLADPQSPPFGSLTFSPGGGRIAFPVAHARMHGLSVINADGSDQNRIPDTRMGDANPAWSPTRTASP